MSQQPGRNDPCPCGSGKKYKRCCADKSTTRAAAPNQVFGQLINLFHAGQFAEVERQAQRLVREFPDSGLAWKILGTAQGVQKKDALSSLLEASRLLPNDPDVYNSLGNAYTNLGQYNQSIACFRRVLEINPRDADAHNNLGVAYKSLGNYAAAIECYQHALTIHPSFAEAYYNLGNLLNVMGKLRDSVINFRKAISFRPGYAVAYRMLGKSLHELGEYDEALAVFNEALTINPNYGDLYVNLANLQVEIGQCDASIVNFERALSLDPDSDETFDDYFFVLHYFVDRQPEYGLELARKYGNLLTKRAVRLNAYQYAKKPERLKIGLVSGDLRVHPVGYFLENFLHQIDPGRLEVIAYPTFYKVDDLTSRMQSLFAAWKPIYGMNDLDAARLIQNDGVHILIDLSGHTAHNRLPLFAYKAAPIQASWLGYFATTGVAEIDYLIADHTGVPPDHQRQFMEKTWYLPDTRLCFTPPADDIPVSSLPALSKHVVTFGCFQTLAKINDSVLSAWGQILKSIPQARLCLMNRQFKTASVRDSFLHRLLQQGIQTERVELNGSLPRNEYFAKHAEIDILLDTFPYPGGTTTCEGLWMGVPTLTLAGDSLLARQGASLLHAAGVDDWIAYSTEEYIAKAVQFANDLPNLASLRAKLRPQTLSSPLCDAPRFARNFEDAMWGMWNAYLGAGKS